MKRYHIWTIGCQMNDAESRRTAEGLEALGYLPTAHAEEADVIVLNTCVVRQSAEDRALGRISALKPIKQERPETVIAVMGCLVGQDPNVLKERLPYVDVFLPPAQIDPLFAYLKEHNGDEGREVSLSELKARWQLMDEDEPAPVLLAEHPVAAYVSVIHGCNHRCTFCIVPFRRGPERSRPIPEIVEEVRSLVARGAKEVSLLGQIVDSYGHDLPGKPDLADLLAAVHEIEGLYRIRFLTSHPVHFSDRIIEAIATLDKVCEHIEIPVQAGDDMVLKRMARGYKVAYYKELVAKIRERISGVSIATDIIVGFPGETEEQFMSTYRLLEELELDVVHVAAFSPRPGTVAADRFGDDVTQEEKERRRRAVEELQEKIATEKHAQFVGQVLEVLVEEDHKGKWKGRTRTNKLVFFEDADNWRRVLARVQITWAGPWSMQGVPIKETIGLRAA